MNETWRLNCLETPSVYIDDGLRGLEGYFMMFYKQNYVYSQ